MARQFLADIIPSRLVLDLPHPSTRPSAESLLTILSSLKIAPIDFSGIPSTESNSCTVQIEGNVSPWLTSLIKSPLSWLPDDNGRETVWEAASSRLAERAGSMGQSSLQRQVRIPMQSGNSANGDNDILLTLIEPAVTGGHLGTKTWGSAYLLACAIPNLTIHVPSVVPRTSLTAATSDHDAPPTRIRILELGAGTGLAGMAACAIWHADVDMTDLEGPVLDNLRANIDANSVISSSFPDRAMRAFALDWSTVPAPSSVPDPEKYPIVLAADSIYESEHPGMLANAVAAYLGTSADSRFICELPLRKGYEAERASLEKCLKAKGLTIIAQGSHWGYDEHGDRSEKREHSWAVWRWAETGDV